MKDEFLLLDDLNVIVVDWSAGNFIPYTQAAANTERVGEEISSLILTLIVSTIIYMKISFFSDSKENAMKLIMGL